MGYYDTAGRKRHLGGHVLRKILHLEAERRPRAVRSPGLRCRRAERFRAIRGLPARGLLRQLLGFHRDPAVIAVLTTPDIELDGLADFFPEDRFLQIARAVHRLPVNVGHHIRRLQLAA